MSVEVLQVLTLVFFIISAALGLFAVFLFFALKIPKVLGDLSGVTARKAIEDIQKKSQSGNSQQLSYSKNIKGFMADKSNSSGKLRKGTGKLAKEAARSTGKLKMPSNITAKLVAEDSNATVLLSSQTINETTILGRSNYSETTILGQSGGNETTLLAENAKPLFSVDVDISLCDSVETID